MIYTIIDIRIQESNELIPLFLIASYTYYHCDRSIISNDSFDYLVSRLRNEWHEITHPYKHLIKEENLQTDSGYNIDFPLALKKKTNSRFERYFSVSQKYLSQSF